MSRETAEEKGKKGEKESEEIGTETEKEESFPPQKVTKGVGILLGDPEKAVIKLSIPIIVAMSVQTIYSLTDTFWVAGLGADALAAVGFAFPFFCNPDGAYKRAGGRGRGCDIAQDRSQGQNRSG